MDLTEAAKHPNALVLINDDQRTGLEKSNTPFALVKAFDNYPNENMTLPFIIQAKRLTTLNHFFLVRLTATAK
jgi:hypothetical protein